MKKKRISFEVEEDVYKKIKFISIKKDMTIKEMLLKPMMNLIALEEEEEKLKRG